MRSAEYRTSQPICAQTFAEGHVALQAVARKALDRHFALRDRRGGEEVAGGRGVGLDRVAPCRGNAARRVP